MTKSLLFVAVALATFPSACNQSSFTGTTPEKKAPAAGAALPAQDPPTPTPAAAPAPTPTPIASASPSPSPTPTATPSATPSPTPTPTLDSGGSSDGIEFGVDGVFHIGDGKAQDSTCQSDLATYPLSGTKYYFDFEVLEDQTDVAITVQKICGVDYASTNTLKLVETAGVQALASAELPLTEVTPSSTGFVPFASQRLAKGKYSIVIESAPNAAQAGDEDDFVVGQIKVNANHKVQAIGVRAE